MRPITILLLILTLTHFTHAQSLKPGMKPPPVTAWKWLKGKPINEFKPGKIYVVEFGATWCSPCAAAIPELSALAEKYKGDVEVVGFFVMEQMSKGQGAYGDNVERYVKKRWIQMNYTVALDDVGGTMQREWLKNAGQTGVPFTVVIDRKGVVAWTGNNVKALGDIIESIIN